MSSVVISGNTSGSVTLAASAIAGTTVYTLAPVSGTISPLVSGTAVASTSGTSIDFTGIPSWAKRITVMFSGVSKSGTSDFLVQIGNSGGIENIGYLASSSLLYNAAVGVVSYTSGFGILANSAAISIKGSMVITKFNGNEWISNHTTGCEVAGVGVLVANCGGGNKLLSATLDRIRITTVNGTDLFDAGTINIMYE